MATSHPLSPPAFPWSSQPTLTPQEAVRTSCTALEPHSLYVHLNRQALRRFILSLPPSSLLPPVPRPVPLRFTLSSSINFHCLLSFLQFGSGYRSLLHSITGRGASDTVTAGCMAMHITAPSINADFLCQLTVTEVGELFRIPVMEDYEIQRGIHSERKSPLYSLAESIQRVCNECGAVLRSLQCPDFSAFVLRSYHPHHSKGCETTASLLTRLITHFPSLRDEYTLSPTLTVHLYKRAQLLVYELALHHSPHTPVGASPKSEELAYEVGDLTAFADNVLPCVLNAEGVLEYSAELKGRIERGEEVKDERMQAEMRGMSVVAVEEMVRVYNEEKGGVAEAGMDGSSGREEVKEERRPINAAALDYHIWAVAGKTEEMRKRPRHSTRGTVFY